MGSALKALLPIRTYLVEDNAIIRENLAATLVDLSQVEICGEATGEHQAALWFADHANDWDLAIVDVFLAQGSGLKLLALLQSRQASQRVVVFTNFASKEVRARAQALGADAVFDKSREIDDLIAFCRSM